MPVAHIVKFEHTRPPFVSFDTCTILLKAAMAHINSDKVFLWKPSSLNDHIHRQIFGKRPVKFLTFKLKSTVVQVWIWLLLCSFMQPRERSVSYYHITHNPEWVNELLLCGIVIIVYYSTLADANYIVHSKEDPGPKDECIFLLQYFFLWSDSGRQHKACQYQRPGYHHHHHTHKYHHIS